MATKRRRVATGRKARPATPGWPKPARTARQSRAGITEEYRALRRRAFRIVRDMHGPDRRLARQATGEWEKLVDDFRAWAKRNGVKIITRAIKSASQPEDAGRRFGTSPDGCEALVGGAMANGQTLECILCSYDQSRSECIYDCVIFDRNGWIVT